MAEKFNGLLTRREICRHFVIVVFICVLTNGDPLTFFKYYEYTTLKDKMSDSEDDLISYGTALEPLEEDEIPCKKPRLLEDQVVKDKQGRRRFHGAFTGGFSAGFFNTVGSLEGWTPSLFKSSKSKKQEIFQQRPEDFMDEEDLSEFGIAPLVLKAKGDYINAKDRNNASDMYRSPALGTYVLQDLYKPVRETVGIKLLRKMGWKPGQGVGPRLRKAEKKDRLKRQEKTYGCQMPPGPEEEKDEADSESDAEWDEVEFAPSDYEPVLCEARNNFYGLGYQGLDKRLILSASPTKKKNITLVEQNQNRKLAFGSQAFGVGAFEEEDEDIYARDDMSRYDFSLGNDPSADSKKSPDKKHLSQEGVIDGFSLERTRRPRKSYPLPVLPKDFKPRHRVRVSRFDDPSAGDKSKGPKHNSESRKQLIETLSNEDLLKEKRKNEMLTRELISNVKISTSNSFRPFSNNPEKQERYESYLKLIEIGKKERLSDLQPLTMTDWDKEREKVEFEKAASLFRPLTGEMRDRFSTASQPDDISDPLAVVEKFQDDRDDARKAARMNMYGQLTRKTEDWAPSQILCKRFNIPVPTNSNSNTEKKTTKTYVNLFTMDEWSKPQPEKVETPQQQERRSPIRSEVKEEPDPEPEKQTAIDQSLNDVKDKADLFKAIFLASDDESEEEETKKDEEGSSKIADGGEDFQNVLFEEKVINSKRNLSPPKGLFENIDLELLSSRANTTDSKTSKDNENTKKSPPPDLMYGPKIPEKTIPKTVAVSSEKHREDEIWVEKKVHKKHKKKEKKSKKSSHKTKHKHKKYKR